MVLLMAVLAGQAPSPGTQSVVELGQLAPLPDCSVMVIQSRCIAVSQADVHADHEPVQSMFPARMNKIAAPKQHTRRGDQAVMRAEACVGAHAIGCRIAR